MYKIYFNQDFQKVSYSQKTIFFAVGEEDDDDDNDDSMETGDEANQPPISEENSGNAVSKKFNKSALFLAYFHAKVWDF